MSSRRLSAPLLQSPGIKASVSLIDRQESSGASTLITERKARADGERARARQYPEFAIETANKPLGIPGHSDHTPPVAGIEVEETALARVRRRAIKRRLSLPVSNQDFAQSTQMNIAPAKHADDPLGRAAAALTPLQFDLEERQANHTAVNEKIASGISSDDVVDSLAAPCVQSKFARFGQPSPHKFSTLQVRQPRKKAKHDRYQSTDLSTYLSSFVCL